LARSFCKVGRRRLSQRQIRLRCRDASRLRHLRRRGSGFGEHHVGSTRLGSTRLGSTRLGSSRLGRAWLDSARLWQAHVRRRGGGQTTSRRAELRPGLPGHPRPQPDRPAHIQARLGVGLGIPDGRVRRSVCRRLVQVGGDAILRLISSL
jgi:hypothetical protein